jgi:CO/xanthine dehydrogenase Mo-binding subunit
MGKSRCARASRASRAIGVSVPREDGREKVHGQARYADDLHPPGLLYAAVLRSPHAHARIRSLEFSQAAELPGVRGVFSGSDFPRLIGIYLGDKSVLAMEKVRHYGEGVAAVVADSEAIAREALERIKVDYEPLPVIAGPREALAETAVLVHERMDRYFHIPAILPEPGSNIANRTRIRKGDAAAAFRRAEVTVEGEFSLPPGDHAAMELRSATASIGPDGRVLIRSSTQSPFVVRMLLSRHYGIPPGKIRLVAPRVGGGFGGKAGIQLEALAYQLSARMGGRPVRVANSREEDMAGSPGRPGLEARIKLGAGRDGLLVASEVLLLFDAGAYADYAVNVSRAAGYAASGPYRVPNLTVDSLCVYTNHPFATAFRGFGHIEMAFAVEGAMDLLAAKLNMDPARLRLINAVRPGDTTPGRSVLDASTGDLPGCIEAVTRRLEWEGGLSREVGHQRVRAKGISCFWKAPAIPPNTDAGAVLSFNEDGSVNLMTGVVEIGQGTHTGLAQLLAERLGIDPEQVHVVREVSTDTSPHDWATAASRSLFMAGRAALAAAEDALVQIKQIASAPLRCPVEDLEVRDGRVFPRHDPEAGLPLGEVVLGYVYANGNSIGGPVIGRGSYIARGLTGIEAETGEGNPGLEWTLGAEAVEVELDRSDGSFRILKAACCMDVGRLVNPRLARAQAVGAMMMGIGFSTGEGFIFDNRERLLNGSLRDFKIPRYGEQPEYLVDFLETPQLDGPYGLRGMGEQGILGMPAALAGALSRAVGRPVTRLPLSPESLWRLLKAGGEQ